MAILDTLIKNVNILPTGIPTPVHLSQSENGRTLSFEIIGGSGELPAGSVVTLTGTKPDGVVYSAVGTLSGNIATFEEDVQLTAAAGVWPAKIEVTNGGHMIATGRISFTIDADPVAPGSVPSESELDGLVAQAAMYAENARSAAYGSPLTAATAADMIDTTRVYVYTGNETGMENGHWYYWEDGAWKDGGIYNAAAVQTDTSLSIPGMAADAKATGEAIAAEATAREQADTDLKADLNGSIENLDDGKLKIAPTFVFGTLDTNGVIIPFANNSRCSSVEYYTAKNGDVLTLDAGFSMILCEYNASKTLVNRGVKTAGDYTLTVGNLYRVTIFSADQTIQNNPYEYAFKAHLQSEIDKKIESVNSTVSGLNSDISNLENVQVINAIVPDVTYHNDGYVNASTNDITSIATTAEYFYSDLIQLYANDVVTVNYRDTLDVVWVLSKWTDTNTFDGGILKGNNNEGVQTYSFTATSNMYIRHSARYLNDITIKRVNGDNIEVVSNAVATDLGVVDYGYLLNSFLKIGAVGDSLASGECISGNPSISVSNDLYEHSWLQYMARYYGFIGINFSKGGMTTRGWLFDDEYGQQGWTKAQIADNKCNAYIVGIGANDMGLILENPAYLGTPSDIGTTNPTFYRYYAQIISNLKTIQPKAKFFLFTLTWLYTETAPYDSVVDDVNDAITYIAEHTENCYLINLDADRWYYGVDNTGNKRMGHYNAIGYNMQAMHLARLIGNYMHSHQSEFRQIEFIGTDLSWTN